MAESWAANLALLQAVVWVARSVCQMVGRLAHRTAARLDAHLVARSVGSLAAMRAVSWADVKDSP
jgi:hypothetical protein